ncbi:MAG: tetratricopeptide repeat protein [Chloroflexota bacterium]
MAYQEEEKTKLRRQFSKEAIALAMQGRWREAVVANKSLIENFPNDVDAYNRLGRAHMELGEYPSAKGAYQKAVELDPYNTIAKKNLSRLSLLEKEAVATGEGSAQKVEPQQFIEEVGKAGVVNLHRLAPPPVLARLVAGASVNLRVENANLVAENGQGEYLGQVDPRHAQRLVKLMESGNKYSAAVVSSTEQGVTIIIREVFQHPSQAGRPSFPSRGPEGFRPYIADRIIRRGLEYEEVPEGSGYTIIGGDESELSSEESVEIEEEEEDEETENGE